MTAPSSRCLPPPLTPRHARTAKLVALLYEVQDHVEVLKKELQPMSFDDLDEDQQTWLLERLCVELQGLIETNLSAVGTSDAASLPALTSAQLHVAGSAAKHLFRKGETLKVIARNAAILAAFRSHRALKAKRLKDMADQFADSLETIVDAFGVDLTAESLRRYLGVGELFDRCSALLFCDCLRALMDHCNVVGAMLDNPQFMRQLDSVCEQRLRRPAANDSPIVDGVDNGDAAQGAVGDANNGTFVAPPNQGSVTRVAEDSEMDCSICGQSTREGVFLCDAEDCGISFHPSCAGYPRPPTDDPDLPAYCKDCLEALGLKSDDVLWQEDEKRVLEQYFAAPACPFVRVRILGDGTCIMGAIWAWLEWNGGSRQQRSGFKSREDMLKKISVEALAIIRERSQDELSKEERKECIKVWKAIGQNAKSIASHWNSDALDYTWAALPRLLVWVSVDIWQWSPPHRDLQVVQAYRQTSENHETLAVLCSNHRVLPHYDLLIAK